MNWFETGLLLFSIGGTLAFGFDVIARKFNWFGYSYELSNRGQSDGEKNEFNEFILSFRWQSLYW